MPACRRRQRRKTDRADALPSRRQRATAPTPASLRGSRSSNHESRITSHESRVTAVPALPCAGGLPPQRPPCVCQRGVVSPTGVLTTGKKRHRVRAPPTDRASDQPALAPEVPGHWPLAKDHWQLSTVHYSLSTAVPQSAPNAPCKSLRNVLYCKVEPEHNQAPPERTASHNCPPTLPRPPAMSTCPELNVRTLPPANIAPGAAATNRQCTTRPSAAPPIRSRTRRGLPPMPALQPPASVSCHEEHATDTILRTFCTKTTSFAHFQSKNDRELTAAASCYESPCQYPVTRREKVFSKLGLSGQNSAFDTLSIPCRYPVSEKIAAGMRQNWTLFGQFWTDSAPFLRTCAALPKRRLTPPQKATLISARAGEVARDEALYSPNRPEAPIPQPYYPGRSLQSAADETGVYLQVM